jgi:hypothetical protein
MISFQILLIYRVHEIHVIIHVHGFLSQFHFFMTSIYRVHEIHFVHRVHDFQDPFA